MPTSTRSLRPLRLRRALGLAVFAAASALPATARGQVIEGAGAIAVPVDSGELRAITDSLAGRSGKLRMRLFSSSRGLTIPILSRLFGERAVSTPGIHPMRDSSVQQPVKLITVLPFSEKTGAKIGAYRMGFWPAEKKRVRGPAYTNPEGFIEVTPDNVDQPISEHFRLGDFVTHNQADVWPKYIVLREELVDKLELVLAELRARGINTAGVRVMSGFRTPEYNAQGVGPRRGGRARDSRHQFGDAADVIIDSDGDGRMDDLNRDRKINAKDNQVILDAVNRVEQSHPELVGGFGVYRGTRQHGPFVHIDVRGDKARWSGAIPRLAKGRAKKPVVKKPVATSTSARGGARPGAASTPKAAPGKSGK
ncbi:MAG: hypothetical protein HYX65_06120 [Gemmatimonadetes bacterium]|nr:hypothetical protein [Gemmatimonadota bacterium]